MEESGGGSQHRAGTMAEGDGHPLPDLRRRAILALTEAPTVTPTSLLQALVSLKYPLEVKYQEVDVARVLRENVTAKPTDGLVTMSRAFNILEKYGRNLLSLQKPKFWRAVKFNNPVFKSTVDGIQGGRCILRLYGYTVEQVDGMCFPEDVLEPDHGRVAAVTVEVAMLQMELDKLQKGTHPHPELFSRFLPPDVGLALGGQQEETLEPCPPASNPAPEEPSQSAVVTAPLDKCCAVCSKEDLAVRCHTCGWLLCRECDALYHRHPSRGGHQRAPLRPGELGPPPSEGAVGHSPGTKGSSSWPTPLGTLASPLPQEDRPERTARPGLGRRSQSADQPSLRPAAARPERRPSELASALSLPRAAWTCASCGLVNEARAVLCGACERPRASPAPLLVAGGDARPGGPVLREGWSCQACTFRNDPSAVLCSACERPRLAGRPSFVPVNLSDSILEPTLQPTPGMANQVSSWECPHCTFLNQHPGRICEVCDRTRSRCGPEPAGRAGANPQAKVLMLEEQRPAPGIQGKACGPVPGGGKAAGPVPGGGGACERARQEEMRAAGLRLVHLIRKGEEQGWSPEEVFCALQCCGGGDPLSWLQTDLPQVLSSITELASQEGQAAPEDEVGPVTREEARRAWLDCGGDFEEAVRECVRTRACKFREIREMGFLGRDEVLQALYMNGGDVDKAIVDLQRQLLEPFHAQIWQETETAIQLDQPDRQRVVRQILATYNLPSWGRAEIVVSLMQEGRDHYQMLDVVEAVRESQDKEFIKRMLSLTCLVCLSLFPRSKMQSVTSCECTICRDCFKNYFTFTVRERNIKNLVCPGCSKPDIDDEGQLLGYFSTLDVQLRDCLDSDVYNLFHKKLTERTLMKDPKFKWCTHCSNGFIYDGNQNKVTCPQCKGSFCVECKRPWESQHQGISCEDFQNWKRENDPEYQAQGLAAYLKENGIDCPNCKFRYSLAKGGCMHFTCSQCQYEFCSGCYNTFLGKKKCVDPICVLKDTLHAHHPRDCLFYLRDWPVDRLQTLLQNNNVIFDREPPLGAELAPGGLCRVKEQKEVGDNLTDAPCGAEARQGHAGLCESHYKEYLVSRINAHSLDPAQLFDREEIQRQLARSGKGQPERLAGEEDGHYKTRLLQIISGIPLGDKIPRVRK